MAGSIASLIVNIGADTVDLKKGIAEVNKSLGSFESSIGKVGKMLAGAFTVTAIIGAGKKVIDFASQMTDLAAKTGISTTGLQKLNLAFQESGIAIGQVTKASTELGAKLIGDKSAIKLIEQLGLSVDALRRMKPEDQFMAVADAVGQIQNKGEQLYASKTLFGKGGTEILGGLTGHLKETTDEFERLGMIMDEQTVQAADDFGDQIGLLSTQLLALAGKAIGPLLPILSLLVNGFMTIADGIMSVVSPAIDFVMRAFWNLSIQLDRFMIWILDAVKKIPLLGKHLGIADTAITYFADDAKYAQTQLDKLNGSVAVVAKTVSSEATPALLGLGETTTKAADATQKLTAELRQLTERSAATAILDLERAFFAVNASGEANQAVIDEVIERYVKLASVAGTDVSPHLQALWRDTLAAQEQANVSIETYLSTLQRVGDVDVRPPDLPSFPAQPSGPFQSLPWVDALAPVPDLDGPGRAAGSRFLAGFGEVLKDQLGPTLMAAFTGGGDVLKSVGGLLGGELGKRIISKFSESFSSSGLGKVLSSVLPGLGSLLGPALSGIGKLFGKLFGGEGKKVNDMRDQFIAAAGGLDALNQKAVAAGTTLDKLLAAKKVKDFEAAVSDLNATMGEFAAEQAADAERLTAAIEKYGFTFEELAPKMQQSDLNSQAKELIEDWRVLTAAFEDTVPVNAKMGDSINAYLATALKVGAEIPSAMKPILQSMIDQGLLTDEAGNKITDLEASGIKFSETLTEGFDRVVEKLQELLDKIGGVSSGLKDIPREIDVGVNYREGPFPSPDRFLPGDVAADGLQGFAHGTGGQYLDFGAGTPVMLHGQERVMTRGESSDRNGLVLSELQAIGRLLRTMPMLTRDMVQIAMAR